MLPLTISTIQSNIFWLQKEANLKMFEEKILSINEQTEIVILPEMFSTGFTHKPQAFAETMDGPTIAWMKNLSEKRKIVLTGSIIIEEDGKYFNRLIWMLPNGEMGIYDKRHLFSYAGENENFSAGKKRLIASVKGWKLNLQICYDLRFPVWARQNIKDNVAEYDVLINIASWPEHRRSAWNTLLHARSIENMCYTIGVNRVGVDGNNIAYSGDTSIVDPLGNFLYTKEKDEDIFTITLRKENLEQIRSKYPFLNDADNFLIVGDKD